MKETDLNKILELIYKKHLERIKNAEVPNRKIAICFAGIPGSGKTHIAKILEERYKGIRIENDNLRIIIRKICPKKTAEEKQGILQQYLKFFMENYNRKNNLLIFDRGIERAYQRFFPHLRQNKFKIFVIKIKISYEKIESNVKKKLRGKLDKNYTENIEKWKREFKEFETNYKSDITIENENNLNLEPLFRKLDKLIK
ncbi:AAA family ATPase [Nanoarchaeota archaeon]